MALIDQIRREALKALIPPQRLRLSEWVESEIRLPEGVSAQPGPVELWPFQKEIADCMGDPRYERVTVVKSVRIGYSMLLASTVASFVSNDPAPILALLPTEADARDFVVSDLEPTFSASPMVASALSEEQDEAGRNTLLSRRFPGGSLKVVAAKSPRNLRRHNVRVLVIDEADAMEQTQEGSPITLAERRTLSFPDRRIIMGSTPTFEETSHVIRAYGKSDARVFEVPCPECGTFTEIQWRNIEWDEGQPETAYFRCPHCAARIEERHKAEIVQKGAWRATRPEVRGHAGFKLNALVSPHANASWGKLATEFLSAKDDPTLLQVFVNTILGEGWKGEGDELAEDELAARAEACGLDQIPEDVLALTVGIDTQHDRLEATFCGWTEAGGMVVLGHKILWGSYEDESLWRDLDDLLRTRFAHALGGKLAVDAACIDAGDGASMKEVMAFATPRLRRKIVPIKGMAGNRPILERGGKTKTGGRIWICGVDTVKTQLFGRVMSPSAVRFSDDLPRAWFEQLASERAVVRYRKGQPVRSFERVPGRRAEALDCTVYAIAARQIVNFDADRRRAELARPELVAKPRKPVLKSSWIGR
ncbi:phage terminase large subunit family protein [Celeribacter halophilus]|uniref:Phage terminase, large subunit GpA n=1 Tax=Celeribacter halophilus TaxID=576117 RepID=A0A1I3NQQ7_9RHOB|nr:phage terminase large subunit family protein [Celeribacter halophilus]PZX14602.1 phage terminase large subunit GpA-like protein [Celeribacter halophilus]SFJ11477.1 Phage terminase, large subunit GpA [Celeribacter halophilus]